MSLSVSLIGASVLALLLAGYYAQRYLPPPPPKLVGLDLGTTYSSIGVYQAGTGEAKVIPDPQGRRSIPSVVSFMPNGTVYVGYDAVVHAEHNPEGTIYDAKRFIGKNFTQATLDQEAKRYPFKLTLNGSKALFLVPSPGPASAQRRVTPEEIGGLILSHLLHAAALELGGPLLTRAVISVPAEFDEAQRNATVAAANLAGLDVYRVINEPTAAALAYGLHKKRGVGHVLIVDLGGGTLDVSLLAVQAGMFLTRAMAGNNHLGGQDFTQRLLEYVLGRIGNETGASVTDPEDMQTLRQATEEAKLELAYRPNAHIHVSLHSLNDSAWSTVVTREEFEALNEDLFQRVLSPIRAALEDVGLPRSEVDEVVMVGGSTRIPRVRDIVSQYFRGRISLNEHIDPDLAVVTGVAVQSGVMGGGWPLVVGAVELPARLKKIHVYD